VNKAKGHLDVQDALLFDNFNKLAVFFQLPINMKKFKMKIAI
jgi:hypothetical protein